MISYQHINNMWNQ